MYKEAVISIVIVCLVIIGNIVTQNYTKESVEETSNNLMGLRGNLVAENVDNKKAQEDVKKIYEQWNERYNKLAYYIEHDELEKVETNLTLLQSYIETREYYEAVSELDKNIYILKHIEDKNKFCLVNIF